MFSLSTPPFLNVEQVRGFPKVDIILRVGCTYVHRWYSPILLSSLCTSLTPRDHEVGNGFTFSYWNEILHRFTPIQESRKNIFTRPKNFFLCTYVTTSKIQIIHVNQFFQSMSSKIFVQPLLYPIRCASTCPFEFCNSFCSSFLIILKQHYRPVWLTTYLIALFHVSLSMTFARQHRIPKSLILLIASLCHHSFLASHSFQLAIPIFELSLPLLSQIHFVLLARALFFRFKYHLFSFHRNVFS